MFCGSAISLIDWRNSSTVLTHDNNKSRSLTDPLFFRTPCLPPPHLEPLLPLLLRRRPPAKPPGHSLARSRRAQTLALAAAQHASETVRRSSTLSARGGIRLAIASRTPAHSLRLTRAHHQLGHLTAGQHLYLAGLRLFSLSPNVALGFAVCTCALLFCELGVGFLLTGLLRDGAGGGDPVVGLGV
jgi:hypothetical protein